MSTTKQGHKYLLYGIISCCQMRNVGAHGGTHSSRGFPQEQVLTCGDNVSFCPRVSGTLLSHLPGPSIILFWSTGLADVGWLCTVGKDVLWYCWEGMEACSLRVLGTNIASFNAKCSAIPWLPLQSIVKEAPGSWWKDGRGLGGATPKMGYRTFLLLIPSWEALSLPSRSHCGVNSLNNHKATLSFQLQLGAKVM